MAFKLDKWQIAQKKHRLSDKQVQMAMELGLNPDKLGKIDNHKQEPWKAPLPQFIESIYLKRFKREEPLRVKSIKELMADKNLNKEKQKRQKEQKRKVKSEQDKLLTEGYSQSKTQGEFVNPSDKIVISNKEHRAEIKLESGDSPDTILRKESCIFDEAFDSFGKEQVTLSELGFAIKKIHPRYKPRRYGCKTLGAIYEKLEKYELIDTTEKDLHKIVRLKRYQE